MDYKSKPQSASPFSASVVETDVFIAGSGPVGATFARKLVDAGLKVYMVEIGAQETAIPGEHKKNNYIVQKDINSFINVVQGELDLLSVATDRQTVPSLDPSSWSIDPHKATIANGQNPNQDNFVNMPAASATRNVGGMSSHWTCCVPRQHPKLERSTLFNDKEWNDLYTEAEGRIKKDSKIFDDSIRQQLVARTLAGYKYPDKAREFLSMPLAVQKLANQSYLEWSASATLFGDITKTIDRPGNTLFTLRSQVRCTKLARNVQTKAVEGAMCKDFVTGEEFLVKAKKYVIAAGAVLTPGILYNSGYTTTEVPALGKYLTEQTLAFCQIVLSRSLVENVVNDPYHLGWKAKVDAHHAAHPNDPLPFPFTDADPQVYSPVSDDHPWHTQIHRDAFSYGQVPATVDQRLIVDLRWFGYISPQADNRVEFTTGITDQFGMPQPTFFYKVPPEDTKRAHEMMADMCDVALKLGGYLPGAEPKFLVPGSALHISGTTRAGTKKEDSVVDKYGKMWVADNVVLGGCNVIPTGAASNPTLTAMAFAIAAADKIATELGKHASA